uniref:Uncharacterized protein n=1 Tax=Knipowitschia caucasica TaxID=637954 RepID=A0AAV2KQF9_KNICA
MVGGVGMFIGRGVGGLWGGVVRVKKGFGEIVLEDFEWGLEEIWVEVGGVVGGGDRLGGGGGGGGGGVWGGGMKFRGVEEGWMW